MNHTLQVPSGQGHLPALDGVRALSIVALLVTHLLPVRFGGSSWNDSVGLFGMALFFVLSGFLITRQLLARPRWQAFVVRRLCRILPLAWLCTGVVAVALPLDGQSLLGFLFFYANLPPQRLTPPLDPLWSLCIEVQFYSISAILLVLRPAFTWWLLPLLLAVVTGLRIAFGEAAGSITWFRADDLLAGASLALLLNSTTWPRVSRVLAHPSLPWALLLLLCAASVLPKSGFNELSYFRSYLAAAFVGALIAQPMAPLPRWFGHPALAYVAAVSYALYVWHMPLAYTWLGSGDLLEKYLKRPLLLLVLFAVAHVSTFQYERRFIEWGRQLSRPQRAGSPA